MLCARGEGAACAALRARWNAPTPVHRALRCAAFFFHTCIVFVTAAYHPLSACRATATSCTCAQKKNNAERGTPARCTLSAQRVRPTCATAVVGACGGGPRRLETADTRGARHRQRVPAGAVASSTTAMQCTQGGGLCIRNALLLSAHLFCKTSHRAWAAAMYHASIRQRCACARGAGSDVVISRCQRLWTTCLLGGACCCCCCSCACFCSW
jgi:hypothetical protein